jgi:hypothetical protein
MTTALLEPAAIEEAFEATPTELPAAATTGAIHPPHKITDIAQLPSIWRLEQNIEWLIDRLIPLGSVNLITSESGTGKTWVAYAIAGAVARGEDFAGRAVKQRPVLYLDGENPLGLVKQRLFDLGIPETNGLRVWGGWVGDAPHGPDSALLREFVRQHRPLLIWDSLIDFHDGDEQSASETRRFMKHFRALANLGATILILHHTGKTITSQDYRGSSDIKAAVDMAYVLEPESTLMGGIYRPSHAAELQRTIYAGAGLGAGVCRKARIHALRSTCPSRCRRPHADHHQHCYCQSRQESGTDCEDGASRRS